MSRDRDFKEGDLLLLVSPDKKSFVPVMFMSHEESLVHEELGMELCKVFDPEEGEVITVFLRRLAWPDHDTYDNEI